MDKKLQKVLAAATKASAEYQRERADLEEKLSAAVTAQKEAADLKAAALKIEDYNAAAAVETNAKDTADFYQSRLNQLEFQPFMSEDEYNANLEAVDQVVKTAAAHFTDTAARLMPEIIEAKKEYMQAVEDADEVLAKLDAYAHILQARHRFREKRYVKQDPVLKEDRSAWRDHAVRYKPRLLNLITADPETSAINMSAWRAVVFTEQD